MRYFVLTFLFLFTLISFAQQQQIRQEVVQAEGDVYSAILDTYTGHEVLVSTPEKVVILVEKMLQGNGVVYRHTYDLKEGRFRYTVTMKNFLNGIAQDNFDLTSEEEYRKYMINSWMQMGYTEKKAIKWYEKYGEFEKSKEQSLEQMKILNNELDAYRDTVVAKLQDNDDW